MNRTVIESFEQFSDLIVSFRKEHPDTLSNLPLNKKSFQRFIDERALTCLSDEDGLYFLYDEIGFYTLYYLVAETDRLHIEKQDKDLLLNLNYVVKEGEADRDLDPLYVNSGFERLALNYNYILDFDEYKDMILEKREEADKALAEKHLHIVEKDPDQPEEHFIIGAVLFGIVFLIRQGDAVDHPVAGQERTVPVIDIAPERRNTDLFPGRIHIVLIILASAYDLKLEQPHHQHGDQRQKKTAEHRDPVSEEPGKDFFDCFKKIVIQP